MIKGVIFDLDGVIVSTDEMHYQAWKRLAEELGITTFSREDNKRQRGVSRMESLEVVLEKADRNFSEAEKAVLAERKNDYYKEMLRTLTPADVLPGARQTLEKLHSAGILTALGSASKNAPAIIEQTELTPLFDQIASGLDVTHSKPDPEIFLVAASKLGLAPENCLVVEDAEAGIQAAKAGGMASLAVGPLYDQLGGMYCARGLDAEIDWEEMLG